jgi:hypothetical protein
MRARPALLVGAAIAAGGAAIIGFLLTLEPVPAVSDLPATAVAARSFPPAPAASSPGEGGAPGIGQPRRAAAEPQPSRSLPLAAQPRTPADSAWEDVPLAVRLFNLGPLAPAMKAGLDQARDVMAHCFEEEARREAVEGTRPSGQGGPGALVLRLETRDRAVEVVDAEVEALGTSSRAFVDCCRDSIRGLAFPAPQASPGLRFRLLLPLL